jgi:hypothetical protein
LLSSGKLQKPEDGMSTNISEELLSLFESLLRAQLNVIRQLRKAAGVEKEPPKEKRMSQVEIVYDILASAQRPMHIDDIIAQAQRRFELQLDKESIVSALTKRVKRQDRFVKTAPNTFALLTKEVEGGRP